LLRPFFLSFPVPVPLLFVLLFLAVLFFSFRFCLVFFFGFVCLGCVFFRFFVLVLFFFGCATFAQTVSKCEDESIQGSCFECFLYGPTGRCGWCAPRVGTPGCYSKGAINSSRENLPNNTDICSNPGNIQGDSWIASPNDCNDNCREDPNKVQCQQCIDPTCGWCQDGMGCISVNPDGSGTPWYPFPQFCSDFRWKNQTSTVPFGQLCANYYPCTTQKACDNCVTTVQAIGTTCSWCPDTVNIYTGVCNSVANITCAVSTMVDGGQCPQRSTGGLLSVFIIAHLVAALAAF